MKKFKLLLIVAVFTGLFSSVFAGSGLEISQANLIRHVTYLASNDMNGRLTGTHGEKLATDYVAHYFSNLGLQTYFQEFEFTAGVSLGKENQLSFNEKPFELNQDWRPLVFSKSGGFEKENQVLFAGYGIVAPKTDKFAGYNSYEGLTSGQIKNKWIVVLRYLPESLQGEERQHLMRYSSLRHKAMTAREFGAKGLIIVSGPNSNVEEELVPLTFDASLTAGSLFVLSFTDDLANRLLSTVSRDLKSVQDKLDTGEILPAFFMSKIKMSGHVDIQKEKKTGRNVIGRLNAGNGVAIAIGGHVDHLGRGETSHSRAGKDEKGQIHYGADDNASGVAAVLELAHNMVFAARNGVHFEKDVYFMAWSGEELGLLGSQYFTKHYKKEGPPIVAYLNLDMVGRLREKLMVQGIGSSSIWKDKVNQINAEFELPIVLQSDPYVPTDAMSFYLAEIPVLSMFTGSHDEYHTPRDTTDKINFNGLKRITEFTQEVAFDLVTSAVVPDYIKVKRSGGGRRGFRVYLGTIPDYASDDVKGVAISGVKADSPAEKAGLQAGDILVKLAGQNIENIYDFVFILQGLVPKKTVEMIVNRKGKLVTLSITPLSKD